MMETLIWLVKGIEVQCPTSSLFFIFAPSIAMCQVALKVFLVLNIWGHRATKEVCVVFYRGMTTKPQVEVFLEESWFTVAPES
jgi:hypothetical protein